MPTYVLLMTLTPEGREQMAQDLEFVMKARDQVRVSGVQVMGLYGVLGGYDFVGMVEAEDNAAAAQFSLEFGVWARVHITTLPAIPISRFSRSDFPEGFSVGEGAFRDIPELDAQ